MKIGNTIIEERQKLGLSQSQFASKCGLTPAGLHSIENNQAFPNKSSIRKISQALNIPFEVLLLKSIEKKDVKPSMRDEFDDLFPSLLVVFSTFFGVNGEQ